MKHSYLIYIVVTIIAATLIVPLGKIALDKWFEAPAIPSEVVPPVEEDVLPPDPEIVAYREYPLDEIFWGGLHCADEGVIIGHRVSTTEDGEYLYTLILKSDCDKTVWVAWDAIDYYMGRKFYEIDVNNMFELHPKEEYRISIKSKSKPTEFTDKYPCVLYIYSTDPEHAADHKEMFEYGKGPKVEKWIDGNKAEAVEAYRWWIWPTSASQPAAFPSDFLQ